ncbi:hypothetical protein NWO25_00835 [Enterococcus lactis]|nr:hypothetical protein [Enterococcus lactis]
MILTKDNERIVVQSKSKRLNSKTIERLII